MAGVCPSCVRTCRCSWITYFNQAVALWVVAQGVKLGSAHYLADFLDQSRQEVHSPVREQVLRNSMSHNYMFLKQSCYGLCWHAFCSRYANNKVTTVWSGTANTSGHFIRLSMNTIAYWLPSRDSGSCNTSTPMRWNGHTKVSTVRFLGNL